jgi:hypothetical protein
VSLDDPGLTTLSPPTLGLTSDGLLPPTVSPWLPGSLGQPGHTTTPTTATPSPPSSRPPSTPPPTTAPPAGCTGLVDQLLGGLTSYLGLGDRALDLGLVRQVSDVLGLDRYLGSGLPLTQQLTAPLTPVLDVVPALGDVLGRGLGLGGSGATGSAGYTDAQLLGGLRTLLGVDLGAVTDVTSTALRGLLNAVIGGC